MATIHRIGAIKISMYANEHNPPHVHVNSPDFAVVLDIQTGEVIKGQVRAGQIREAVAWVIGHRDMLLDLWSGRM
ncbi:MAG: DUF4160 domain-containing protein [Desulfovibrionaceae bacterium]